MRSTHSYTLMSFLETAAELQTFPSLKRGLKTSFGPVDPEEATTDHSHSSHTFNRCNPMYLVEMSRANLSSEEIDY